MDDCILLTVQMFNYNFYNLSYLEPDFSYY